MIELKSEREVSLIKEASSIVAEVIHYTRPMVVPGVTTLKLNDSARELILKLGGIPAFKGYRGFPGDICTSINEEVVHGIPGKRRLKDGDILSLDIGVKFGGYYGDAAVTIPVGNVSKEAKRLLEVTEEALYIGIGSARQGMRLSDLSHAIQTHAEKNGFSVVREFVGHGIGAKMHEEPQIPNFGEPNHGPRLKNGMVLAIEPMINAGGLEVEILRDGWTAITKDRRLSAHFEHTVLITDKEPEILTKCQKKKQ